MSGRKSWRKREEGKVKGSKMGNEKGNEWRENVGNKIITFARITFYSSFHSFFLSLSLSLFSLSSSPSLLLPEVVLTPILLQVSRSDQNKVYLKYVNISSAGIYRCEVRKHYSVP